MESEKITAPSPYRTGFLESPLRARIAARIPSEASDGSYAGFREDVNIGAERKSRDT